MAEDDRTLDVPLDDGVVQMTDKALLPPLQRYQCQDGHVIEARGRWVTHAVVIYGDDGKELSRHEFNYCPVCFGAWAEMLWPLTMARKVQS